MSREIASPVALANRPPAATAACPQEGLLITADGALARAFLSGLGSGAERTIAFDVRSSLADAKELAGDRRRWVAIDLSGAVPPVEAVGIARLLWPQARIAVLSSWWSDQDAAARELADTVIHKPLRSHEILAFLSDRPVAVPNAAPPAAATPPLRNAS
ncbi:MAG: hypothetical protein WEE64_07720 [Dehalococcoidia bacterium]